MSHEIENQAGMPVTCTCMSQPGIAAGACHGMSCQARCTCRASRAADYRAHGPGCPVFQDAAGSSITIRLVPVPAPQPAPLTAAEEIRRIALVPVPAPQPAPLTAAEEIRRIVLIIGEPLGLPGTDLPPYGQPGEGCCRDCLRPPVWKNSRCVYCAALHALTTAASPVPEHRWRQRLGKLDRSGAILVLIAFITWTLVILTIIWAG